MSKRSAPKYYLNKEIGEKVTPPKYSAAKKAKIIAKMNEIIDRANDIKEKHREEFEMYWL